MDNAAIKWRRFGGPATGVASPRTGVHA